MEHYQNLLINFLKIISICIHHDYEFQLQLCVSISYCNLLTILVRHKPKFPPLKVIYFFKNFNKFIRKTDFFKNSKNFKIFQFFNNFLEILSYFLKLYLHQSHNFKEFVFQIVILLCIA